MRLSYIDQLKGFAILMVVMGHFVQYCLCENETSWLYKIIYSFHMPLFAFLSGLMFRALFNFKDIRMKFIKQSCKLLLPFISFGVIYMYTIRCGENLLTNQFKLGLWYLLFLWQCYLLTHIYNLFFKKIIDKPYFFLIDVCWLFMLLAVFKTLNVEINPEINNIIGTLHLMKLYPFFFVGYVIKRKTVFLLLFNNKRNYSEVAFILWITLFFTSIYIYSSWILITAMGFAAVYSLVSWFYELRGERSPIFRILETFGKYSLEIYILHRFMTTTCNAEFIGTYIENTQSMTVEVIVACLASVGISYICIAVARFIRYNHILSLVLFGSRK